MSEEMRMALGLVIGLIALVLLITMTRIHVFIAVIICAIFIGLFGGMSQNDVLDAITGGFGKSLSSIGIIIGFGVMLGKLLEISGATKVMADTFIRLFGKNHEEEALAISGFVTSLSIFCTSGFIILSPLMKALSKKTKKSVVALGIALAGGLVASHSLVPPAAGPIGVAGILNANIGEFMLYGTIISIPIIIVSLIYGKYLGKKIYQIPDGDGWTRERMEVEVEEEQKEEESLSALLCFAPILLPIVLIILKTALSSFGVENSVISLLGQPIVALALGLLVAIYGRRVKSQW